ncbi:MAG TPA: hypothetical protein VFV30_13195 [Novosphingobium sp.]|nr:hypothetical protein [Novosphingobium sp.]
MKKLAALTFALTSCGPSDRLDWSCFSGVRTYSYANDAGELTAYTVNFREERASAFGRVRSLHDDSVRSRDMEFDLDDQYFAFGNTVVAANLFSERSWTRGILQCSRIEQGPPANDAVARVVCRERGAKGSLEYLFDKTRGITEFQLNYADGSVATFRLKGQSGLGETCPS